MRGEASLTAKGAATHRAVHQLIEGGRIFKDPFAVSILGEDPEAIVREAEENPERRVLRLFVAARSRFAEQRTSTHRAGRRSRYVRAAQPASRGRT
jgi:O-methyltransferase involved in polyketide biosynthesis